MLLRGRTCAAKVTVVAKLIKIDMIEMISGLTDHHIKKLSVSSNFKFLCRSSLNTYGPSFSLIYGSLYQSFQYNHSVNIARKFVQCHFHCTVVVIHHH